MRYSAEPKYKKYVEGYDFLSFARKLGDKYDKKLMNTAKKKKKKKQKKQKKKKKKKQTQMLQRLLLKE